MSQLDPDNLDPKRIHGADQMWASAEHHLDMILGYVKSMEPSIYTVAGNADSSVLFDWLKNYIMTAEQSNGAVGRQTTLLMCAAALTRLACASRADEDILTRLERELGE